MRYVYRVVVNGEPDEELLVRDEPVTVEATVPYRGHDVVVEEIQDLHETDDAGNDLGEKIESRPDTQIARTLICREPEPHTSQSEEPPLES